MLTPNKKIKQEHLAEAVRAPAREITPPKPGPKQGLDMMKAMVMPPASMSPMQTITKEYGIGGPEGMQTPEGYIYDLFSGGQF